MEGASSVNSNMNSYENAVSNINANSNTVIQPVQKYVDASTDLLKSSSNINTSAVDIYDGYKEKKNDMVAVVVANTRHTNKRPSAALIGGAFGLFETLAFSGIYALTKALPVLKKDKVINYFADKIDSWIEIAKNIHPERSLPRNIFTGVAMKSLYLIGSGLLVGAATDIYKKIKLTHVNGKISKNKQGNIGDNGFVAALNSLDNTDYGKNIIKNSIRKNDDKTVSVRFSGIDREYVISKQEMKEASKSYYAIYDENGKVKTFKKKYCKSDGDLLAFELAYEKFVKDVQSGDLPKDKNKPDYLYTSIIDDDGKIKNSTVEQGYYLLTGKDSKHINTSNPDNNAIQNIYSKIMINRCISNLPNEKQGYSAVLMLRPDDGENAILYDKVNARKRLNVNNYYIVKNVDGNLVTLVNSSVSKEKVTIPVSQLAKHTAQMVQADNY